MSDADTQRDEELRAAIERAHESDRQRIARGELQPADLFWVPAEWAQTAVITWRRRFRLTLRAHAPKRGIQTLLSAY